MKNVLALICVLSLSACATKSDVLKKGFYYYRIFDNVFDVQIKNRNKVEYHVDHQNNGAEYDKYHLIGDSLIEFEVFVSTEKIVRINNEYILDPYYYCYAKNRKDKSYIMCLDSLEYGHYPKYK